MLLRTSCFAQYHMKGELPQGWYGLLSPTMGGRSAKAAEKSMGRHVRTPGPWKRGFCDQRHFLPEKISLF